MTRTLTHALSAYLPQDRRRALAWGRELPDSAFGSALFADVSGFTHLTEALIQALGSRRGAEALTSRLNAVYEALIAEVDRYGGSVIGFAGDSITCWFAESRASGVEKGDRGAAARPGDTARRAAACALGLQRAMAQFSSMPLPGGGATALTLKASVASGLARRFVVGDPQIQLVEALAGAPILRMAEAEKLARPGEVLVDRPTLDALQGALRVLAWREPAHTGEIYAVVDSLAGEANGLSLENSAWVDKPVPADEFARANEFASAPEPPVLAAETVRPWLLPAVFGREQAGQGAFLTEFRPVAALFLRFTGLDFNSADARPRLDAFIRRAQGILQRYEGVMLDLTIGDKGSYLYAAFGAPLIHEDDARRAVKAALELLAAGKELDFLEPLQIGVSFGTMRAGVYGSQTRHVYGVMGDDVNLAARLMSLAAAGEILVSGRVHQAAAPSFAFEPRPPILLKGKAEPLAVFRLVGAQQRRAIRLQEPAYALPMIGRQSQLKTITAKMEMAAQGQGQVVGIVAEAGVGKSRIAAEAIRAARQMGFTGYGGACQSDGANTPYLVWRPIWNAFFDLDPDLPLRKQIRHLEGELEDRAPGREPLLPLLGPLLGLPIPDNDFTRALDPKTRQGALHALLEDCLKAASRAAPLLLVFEDLQWIDALSHDLLEGLARAAAGFSICLLLAYRPPQLQRLHAPRLESLAHFTRVTLAELSPGECEQAIRAKLAQLYPARGGSLPPGLVEKLAARSQGNPFYLEELLNYMHDRGLDPLDPQALERIELPDSLHALILSRIDQLAENEKLVLRVASIIGRMFRASWLTGYYPALGDLAQVKPVLDELERLEITPLDTPEPELIYLFKHIITHEVAYESLSFDTRAQLHEQLAGYLESTHPAAPPLDTLAYHYGLSANQEKQREYFQKAGEAAQAAYANEAALEYYARLAPLLSQPADLAELHLRWGKVLEITGRFEAAEQHYREALREASREALPQALPQAVEESQGKSASLTARSQQALGLACRLRGDYPAALAWLEQARQGMAALGDQQGSAQVLNDLGNVYRIQGNYAAARETLQAGLELARSINARREMAFALNYLGIAADSQGDSDAARGLFEQSLALWRELGYRRGIADLLNNLGIVNKNRGDYTAARELYEESLALRRELGDKRGISGSLDNLGEIALSQGEYAAAREWFADSLALEKESGHKQGIAISLAHLGNCSFLQQDYTAARAWYEESLLLCREIGLKKDMAISLSVLGYIAGYQGSAAAARGFHAESLALSRELDDRTGIASSLIGLACIVPDPLASARLAAAAEALRAALDWAFDPVVRQVFDATLEAARAKLSAEAFERAWAEGQVFSLEEALALAGIAE